MKLSTKILILFSIGFFCFSGIWINQKTLVQANDWQLTDIKGHLPDLHFSLIADTGQAVTEKKFSGYVTLLYFGFTSCPDKCPTTMLKLANVIKELGDDASPIRVLFVSVDPEVDTPQILRTYLKNFNSPLITGLTGSADAIEYSVKRCRAAYQPRDKAGDSKSITHSNAIYIFDSRGHARLLANDADADASFVHDLRHLIQVQENP